MPRAAATNEINRPKWCRWAAAAWFVASLLAGHESIAQATPESRLALVIGNANYKNSPLINPVNDARLMEAALKESGFQVIKAENATIREMRRLVRDFGDRLKTSGGVGLFYFAGHGVQVQGENFLVSVDSDIRHEDEVADDSVNAQVVLEKMQSAGNRMNLVVLDACRNNPFAVKSRSAANGLATMNAPSGSLVAYATAPGAVASDGSGGNGLYTKHLASAIRLPGLPVEEVFKQVRAAVRRDSKNQQTPWENTALEGQFYFRAPAPLAAAPVAAPPEAPSNRLSPTEQSSIELALWDSVKTSVAASDLKLYVDRYPRGAFVDLAKARIEALQTTTLTRAAPTVLEIIQRGAGKLTIKDEYTGLVSTVLDVYPTQTNADATTYSSGDSIASNGTVLAVRLGSYIAKANSGNLWKLPLQTGTSGAATVSFESLSGSGQLTWRVVRKDAGVASLEVQVEMPHHLSTTTQGQRVGLWSAQYKDDTPVPTKSRLVIHWSGASFGTTPTRVATEWVSK